MPQLMPLYWCVSILLLTFIVMMVLMLYYDNSNTYMFKDNNVKLMLKNNWMW